MIARNRDRFTHIKTTVHINFTVTNGCICLVQYEGHSSQSLRDRVKAAYKTILN